VEQKAWAHRVTEDQLNLQVCPICGKDNYHFYINFKGPKDGLWDCKVCGESGNLFQLQEKCGDRVNGVMSMKDVATAGRRPESLPDYLSAHRRLMEDGDALDYLVAGRGYTMKAIEELKLGVEHDMGKKWLLIPYIQRGQLVYAKYRTLPPHGKDFRGISGREAPLYNQDVIEKGMAELIFVEGEGDAIALLSAGVSNVVGVPGANLKKAVWVTKVDEAAPAKIYILYDRDKVGQKAAREMAIRIGIEKVYNIVLPEFRTIDDKEGKDINEWLRVGHTIEEFEVLKAQAKPFDVAGVSNLIEVLDELEKDLEGRGTMAPELDTPWESLTEKMGGCEWGDLVGVIAEGKVGKTTMALNWLDYYARLREKSIPCMMFCQEMHPKRLVRKWMSLVTQTDDTPGRSKITKETVQMAKEIALSMPSDFLFGYTKVTRSEEVLDTIRQAVRRYGVKVVCFDNLQLLVRSIEHSAQETSRLTKDFKQLAMDLNIVIILIIQPNRVKDGEIVAARNAHGSSAIEKDVDAMIALHRNRKAKVKQEDFEAMKFLETDENFDPQLLVRVDLSRYAPGGVTTLWFDGATSTVREFKADEFTAPVLAMNGELPQERSLVEA
jgi:replicative DNA helicase/5S rRNA maturation endonuclease (ribonuclease M5)